MNDVPLGTPPSFSKGFQDGLNYMERGIFEIRQYLKEDERDRFLELQHENQTVTFKFDELQTHIRSDDPEHAGTDVFLSLPFIRP